MSKFLELLAQENHTEAREAFDEMISQKIVSALDTRKREIASSLFGFQEETATDENNN